ncbi:MAG: sensor histidine kinase [Gammaproteobacteria bacterium]|nr:sensor histidine kinase [Gammaproteobacteria bacterium]
MVHLLWSAWVFITPAFAPGGYSARWTLLTALSYPLFVFLYVRVLFAPARMAWRPAVAMIGLCLALLPWYPSGMSYFVFGCVFLNAHGQRPAWAALAQVLLLGVGFVAYAVLLGYPWQAVVWMPLVTVIVGAVMQVEHINQRAGAALKLSQEEVRRLAATAERERIGRDLHDLLGHTLSMVALKSDLAARLVERDPSAARREIEEVAGGARQALDQVRRAVSGIRAAELAGELASARLLLETGGVEFDYEFNAGSEGLELPRGIESILALTVREAVTNIQRHARAAAASVRFSVEGGEAVLLIEDDGRGGAIVPGNGLAGMRERLEAARGSLRIGPGTHGGTRIEARLPLAANDDAGA